MFRRAILQPIFLFVAVSAAAQSGDFAPAGEPQKLPVGVILIKGAEASASDHSTPLPEEGGVAQNVYRNRYLGLSYPLPSGWSEAFKGPPPSDRGNYVLVELTPSPSFKGPAKGTVLVSAQDMFFALTPAGNAMEMVKLNREHLPEYYAVERPPSEVTIAGRSFARFDYKSDVAELHWVVLATQVRCHAVQFIFISRDTKLLETLVDSVNAIALPDDAGATSGKGGGAAPLCIADYAVASNVLTKVDPVLADRKYNPIPVRVIIDKNGRVRHVHVISAFPEQARSIADALRQ